MASVLEKRHKQAVGLLRFGRLVDTWHRRSTRRRKDAENQSTLPFGVPPRGLRLVRASDEEHPIPKIAMEPGVTAETLRNWVKQDKIDAGEREGLTTLDREDLRRLRREEKTLERDPPKATLRSPVEPTNPRFVAVRYTANNTAFGLRGR